MSIQICKRIEQGFGWIKTIARLCKLLWVEMSKVRGGVTWTFAAYNLIRLGGIGQVAGAVADLSDNGDVRLL